MKQFSELHKDESIRRMQQEIQDNAAGIDDLDTKTDKAKTLQKLEPKLIDLNDGDIKAYDDATNQYIYMRIGARLFKIQLTEVT